MTLCLCSRRAFSAASTNSSASLAESTWISLQGCPSMANSAVTARLPRLAHARCSFLLQIVEGYLSGSTPASAS